jgi:FAD/FMN-containing dehydrogenase
MIKKENLVKIVGSGQVSQDAATLESYAKDMSFVNEVKPRYVVRPQKGQDIQKLVKLANETMTPLVPVSSGPPHFRGDTVPGIGGAIIVDLSGMKKILRVDRPRRVAMVEPGVTFGELIPAAAKAGIRLNLPLLPRQSKSVVGSMLEREPVVMPKYQWDVSDPLACTGVIFGTGDEFRTGQAAGPGTIEEQSAVGGVQKAPYGPGTGSYHRLIQGAQGSMGIVTWASLRCEILPSYEEAFTVSSTNLTALLDMASWLIRLRMVNECFILNNTNMAAIFAKNWPADYQRIKSALPAWTLFYVVAGYEFYPEERVAAYKKDIANITQRLGLDPTKSAGGISAYEMMKTVQQPSAEPYWKLRYKGACEDIFFLTVNDRIESMVKTMLDAAGSAGYPASDLGIYLQPTVQGTSVHCEFNLFYGAKDAAEARKVRDLSATATKALLNNGGFFSRPYGENTKLIVNRDGSSVAILNKLKNIFDPNHIMNPGKVCW